MARNAATFDVPRPTPLPAAADDLAAELAEIESLDLGQLRVRYRNRTGRIAPARISRALLVRVLAHRIQVDAFGDLRPDTRRMLDRLQAVADTDAPGSAPGAGSSSRQPPPAASAPRPKAGTLLSREWQGRMERVTVLDQGYDWNGTTYPSLSAAAFAITGTKWNGHRFFGLRGRDVTSTPAQGDGGAAPGHGPRPEQRRVAAAVRRSARPLAGLLP